MALGFFVGSFSDKGQCRPVNQDACCALEAQTPTGSILMTIVCDGVGGLSKGELASTTVVGRFVRWFEEELPLVPGITTEGEEYWDQIQIAWNRLLGETNASILYYGEEQGELLGTTFTGLLTYGDRCLVGQVGDSRAYEIRNECGTPLCEQLTKDQTIVAQEVEAGVITAEEAAHHPRRNVILQAVGTQDGLDPVIEVEEHHTNRVYLVCCDGFYGKLTSEEIAKAFNPTDAPHQHVEEWIDLQCRGLAITAIDRDEKDNITALAFIELDEAGKDGEADLGQSKEPSDASAALSRFPDEAPAAVGDDGLAAVVGGGAV